MQEILHDHHISISIGGRSICNLRFADDIDLMSGSNGELKDLTNRLVDRAMACKKEDSTEKRKIMTNSTKNIIIIMVIFKRLSLKALSALQNHEGGGGTG